MIKKTINYVDFNGNEKTEDFYFNLTEAEITEMELSTKGGLTDHLTTLVESKDGAMIIKTFKDIIAKAYGKRTDDGKFRKSEEISADFLDSAAYSVLFMELVTVENKSAEFIQGVVPAGFADAVAAAANALPAKPVEDIPLPDPIQTENTPAWVALDREPTNEELQNMTPDQLRDAFLRKNTRPLAY